MILLITAGNIVADAVLRYTTNNQTPVSGFKVAASSGFGENKHTVYVNCSLFGKRAESLDPYLKKGTPVTVTGEADLRKWESDNGPGSEITCKVQEVVLQGAHRAEQQPQASAARPPPPASRPPPAGFRNEPPPLTDDDIPF